MTHYQVLREETSINLTNISEWVYCLGDPVSTRWPCPTNPLHFMNFVLRGFYRTGLCEGVTRELSYVQTWIVRQVVTMPSYRYALVGMVIA